jgi:hypothetical protein
VRVVDDLPLRNEPRGCFGKLLHQHDRQGKVAAGKHPALLPTGDEVEFGVVRLGEPRSPDYHVSTAFECRQDVGLGTVLALAMPSSCRSRRMSFSNSAISARMPITSLPVREVVSMLGSSMTLT